MEAVSYTHLRILGVEGLPYKVGTKQDVMYGRIFAVSYTHLDVYKRQGKEGESKVTEQLKREQATAKARLQCQLEIKQWS